MLDRAKDRWIVAVIGASRCDEDAAARAEGVGRGVAERGAVLLTGGRRGVMEAASRGCHEAGGLSIGVLQGESREDATPNPFVDIALRTGLADARNWINICSADALIAISGGWGTLSEIALAMKAGKPVVRLRSWEVRADQPVADVPVAASAEEAVEKAFAMIDGSGSPRETAQSKGTT